MRRTAGKNRDYLKYALIAALLALFVVSAFILLKNWESRQSYFPDYEIKEETLEYNGTEYVLKDSVETFLVMGLDKFEGTVVNNSYNNDQQADFLMLFVFDNDTKTCNVIHINRDTMTDVNVLGVAGNKVDTLTKQISLAHTYGNGRDVSCRNTADAVSNLLMGIKVNHYISLTMDFVAVMNDLVGGVEVTVLEDFEGIDDALVKGEAITLMGEQALHYVRTRYGLEDSSNSTRMLRQQQYIRALYDKYKQCVEADDEFIVEASLAMSDYIVSDRSVTQLQKLAQKLSEYEFEDINQFEGKSVVGEQFMEFYPDSNSITEIVIDNFYKLKV